MSIGLIGRKVGMTQVFTEDGTMVPVSVVAIEPNTVTRCAPPSATATPPSSSAPARARSRPSRSPASCAACRRCGHRREFRLDDVSGYEVGQELTVEELFSAGDLVDVIGVTKGKGFAGTIKRHHAKRGPETHGSDSHRQPGSIGAGTTPGRVYRGTAHGRPHGRRPPDGQEADRRAHRRRSAICSSSRVPCRARATR